MIMTVNANLTDKSKIIENIEIKKVFIFSLSLFVAEKFMEVFVEIEADQMGYLVYKRKLNSYRK